MPAILRYILVNFIIVPFRAKKSAAKYQEIWTKDGSPLLLNSIEFQKKLQKYFGDQLTIFLAMRYGNPSIESELEKIKTGNFKQIFIVPLYPQYSTSTTESSIIETKSKISLWENKPNILELKYFWNEPLYIQSFASQIKKYDFNNFDHILFSFHGLPLKQVQNAHPGKNCIELDCKNIMNEENSLCYQSACYRTVELLVKELEIEKEFYSTTFQSRLTKNWLSPFTDEKLKELVSIGKKRVLIICPSFVSDCLETLHEIEIEYQHFFKEIGGETLTMVEALNSNDIWVENFGKIISEKINEHLN
jgi:ferrochelatase